MRNAKRSALIGLSGLTLLALFATTLFFTGHSQAASGGGTTFGSVQVVGDSTIQSGTGTVGSGQQVQNDSGADDPKLAKPTSGNGTGLPPPPNQSNNPNPAGQTVTSQNHGETGFKGISHFDQRSAGTGAFTNTQFSLEPPDQALCTNGSFVVESVNNAIAVYNTKGKLLTGVEPNSQFLGLAPEIVRPNGPFGPFISDPKCLYDWQTGHWFFSELEIDEDPGTGAFTGPSHTYLAVSKTSNPTGSWTIFNFNTTDDGSNGTTNPGCPCFGDQPLIGTDAFGFYVTTNEFPEAGGGFNGAQVYAISKDKLIAAAKHTAGGSVALVHIDASGFLAPFGGLSYSIQPAVAAPFDFSGIFDAARAHGVEYFLSALQFGAPPYQVLDNRIAVWALTNTRSLLTSSSPNVTLQVKVIGSEVYGQPNPVTQKAGSIPLGDAVGDPQEFLNPNDDRMNQVVLADGNLWAGVNTIIGDGTRTGIAYFIVHPSLSSNGILGAKISNQGYVAVNGNSVFFPSIGVNRDGQGVVAFTLAGPDFFPSSAYIRIGEYGAFGAVHVAGAGAGPDDGFTGYAAEDPQDAPVARWGDYSAAVAAPDGSIWGANEYIGQSCTDAQFAADATCGGTRTLLANWGTFVFHVNNAEGD